MIPKATDFYEEMFKGLNIKDNEHLIPRLMIKFAKLHCIEQAKVISENAEVNVINYNDYEVDKDSILNAYNLENIK